MRSTPQDCVVTGLGVVCAIGHDRTELSEALSRGRDGIRDITRFSTDGFQVHTGAEVPDWDGAGPADPGWTRCLRFAVRAATEAATDAGLEGVAPERIGLVFGTGLTDTDRDVHELAEAVARDVQARGPVLTISTACSSSTTAIGLATEMLDAGAADVVVAGGADVLTPEVFAGFHALGVLTPGKCAPFSDAFGTTLGEGAGFLVLEGAATARARGRKTWATLSGYGLSADGFHETSPDPNGAGVRRAVTAALADADLAPTDVGYVNAHGSGTEANDPAEWRGIAEALGGDGAVPVSSSKGAVGHTQGAAGVVEAIITILAMDRGEIAPTLHFASPRRFAPPDPVPGPRPRPARYRHALCLNSAFGGSNAALVVSRPEPVRVRDRGRAPVGVLGAGVVGPFGTTLEAFMDAGHPVPGRVVGLDLARLAPRLDPRGLDPMSRYLTAAAWLALADAGITVRGSRCDRTGLIVGAVRASPASLRDFRRSIDDRGLRNLSAAAFARIVLNAPAGFCSKLLSLRGPLTVLSVGAGSGLAAILYAAQLLSAHGDADRLVAGAVDELADSAGRDGAAEGAACVVLGHAPAGERPYPRLAGWGIAGPGRLDDAMARARSSAEDEGGDGAPVFDERDFGPDSSATPSALACVAAIETLRRGEADRAWVVSDRSTSVSLALLLTA